MYHGTLPPSSCRYDYAAYQACISILSDNPQISFSIFNYEDDNAYAFSTRRRRLQQRTGGSTGGISTGKLTTTAGSEAFGGGYQIYPDLSTKPYDLYDVRKLYFSMHFVSLFACLEHQDSSFLLLLTRRHGTLTPKGQIDIVIIELADIAQDSL